MGKGLIGLGFLYNRFINNGSKGHNDELRVPITDTRPRDPFEEFFDEFLCCCL